MTAPDTPNPQPPDTEPAPAYRRRRWIVNVPLQSRYVIYLALVSAVVGAAGAALGVWYCVDVAEVGGEVEGALSSQLPRLVWLLLIAACAVVLVPGIALSHRVAGPMYRLADSMRRVRDGQLDFRVRLRRHDHLEELATTFNAMVEGLEGQRDIAERMRAEARARLEAALEKLRAGEAEDLPEALRLIEEAEGLLKD